MTFGYSNDLREKALSYYDRSGKSQEEVSEIFGVGLRTFASWVKLRKEGDYSRRPNQKQKATHKIDDAQLKLYCEKNPEAYLHEIGEHFNVTNVAIFYALKRLNITRKKRRIYSQKETKKKERSF